MNEQAKGLGQILDCERTNLPSPFVFVTGGKGGVGKSSLTLNLGLALGKLGLKVLIVDLDLGLANLNVLAKVNPTRNLEDFFQGRASLADCIHPVSNGVSLVSGSSGTGDMGRPDRARRGQLFDGLAAVGADFDLILGDSSAGIGPDVLSFAAAADFVLLVATPEPASITDVYGILKALDTFGRENGIEVPTPSVVMNRVSGSSEAESLAVRLRSVCSRFLSRKPRLGGWIPESRTVRLAALKQRPFVLSEPRSLSAQCVSRLAAKVSSLVGCKIGPLSS
ncbi:MAG: flagellar biosynthesis protein FlhG [Planctomycetota bacterium]